MRTRKAFQSDMQHVTHQHSHHSLSAVRNRRRLGTVCGLRAIGGVAVALVVSVLAGCGSTEDEPDAQLPADELKPVTLRVHAWAGYAEPLLDDFRKQMAKDGYAVTVETQTATGLEGFIQALRDGEADLISPAHDLTTTFIQHNLVQPLDRDLIPNLNQVNPLILERLGKTQEVIPYIAPLTYGPYAMAYRVSAYAETEAPTSYRAIWDAQLHGAGAVSIADYDTANIYMAALMLGIPKSDLFSMNEDQLQRVEAALRELHEKSTPIYWGDNLPVEQAETLTIGTDWGVGVQQINAGGGPEWRLLVPEEGATAWVDSWMLSAQCDGLERDIAHAFINFTLGQEMQARIARTTSYGVTNMYAVRHMTPEELERFNLTDGDYLSRLVMWQPLSEEHFAAYQALWNRVRQ